MRFDIITIFPDFFHGIFGHGVVKRALTNGLIDVSLHDLRGFTHDRHRTVDDRPFGGGEGMVLKPEPLIAAVESLGIAPKAERSSTRETVILLSAQGARFTQSVARELAGLGRVVLLCGRYEGVDERVNELVCDRELSIGDYVLSGGELGAAVIVDAIMRLIPGVLGNEDSSAYESFGHADATFPNDPDGPPRATHGSGGLLDYPHYTRPAEFRGMAVPEVLSGGDHAAIRKWRRERALEKTLRNRPDLIENADLSKEDQALLRRLQGK
ncbi:tRNA (guanine37-N1)-methyltransferase [Silvibacterium bohemicum]|uniref:tRNA (guanine-N(1)-)-methyltransferase n=1 Tax=Silvibacterium bohemicum TaxID=1577686 RepID=A0A841K4L3_9BACT|nr:tRNA (guanosine(37)-N1)-methyltransferase TrmD [Silvibacterium bohemicum]MBB6146091.1 tRNA (guanine37-N1)-methyltransferase [Silvibacterium bohemicum]